MMGRAPNRGASDSTGAGTPSAAGGSTKGVLGAAGGSAPLSSQASGAGGGAGGIGRTASAKMPGAAGGADAVPRVARTSMPATAVAGAGAGAGEGGAAERSSAAGRSLRTIAKVAEATREFAKKVRNGRPSPWAFRLMPWRMEGEIRQNRALTRMCVRGR